MFFIIPYAVGCGVTAAVTNYIYKHIYGELEDYSDEDSNSLKLDDSIQLIVTNVDEEEVTNVDEEEVTNVDEEEVTNVDEEEVTILDIETSCTSSNSNGQINLKIPDKYLSPPETTYQSIEKKK